MKPSKAADKKTGKPAEGPGGTKHPGDAGGIFDERRVKRLIKLMKRHELTEIDLQQADQRVRICRGGGVAVHPAGSGAVSPGPVSSGAVSPGSVAAPAADADTARMVVVKSPMVGTFYRASGPDAAPFVKVGDRIEPEKTVCIIEAMKVFNEIPAGVSGQVVAILVENGAPVEFGQPLLKVDPEH